MKKINIGDKVKVNYYFSKLNGIITKIQDGSYTVEADGKAFSFRKREIVKMLNI